MGTSDISSWNLEVRTRDACLLLLIFDGRRPLNAILCSLMLCGASHYFLPSSVHIIRCVLPVCVISSPSMIAHSFSGLLHVAGLP